jgi:FMN phosphatase YigB (HAD superfamily)
MPAPKALLLDVGGVFFLPDRQRIVAALARAECVTTAERVDAAHYPAAARFVLDLDVEADWPGAWSRYLDAYVEACGVPDDRRDDAHRHLDSEFADAALWVQPVPGAKEGLAALHDSGVKLGIVTNADGLMAERLAAREILQVGPGTGVEVGCVIDSGNVGVMKPDPRIFHIALDALDVAPEDAWFVGDMPAFDARGAQRAGMRALIVTTVPEEHRGGYDLVTSLKDVVDLVLHAHEDDWPAAEPGKAPA